VAPAAYAAVVAVLEVAQPRKEYPLLVGLVVLRVRFSLYHLVWLEGAPLPPFAL
jgi:hypothetical protein